MADQQQRPRFTWTDLIPYGAQFGLGMLGNKLANRGIDKQNAWSRQNYEQEQRRRNMLQGFAAPSMLKALGYKDPNQIAAMTRQISSSPYGTTGGNAEVPQPGGSRVANVLGAAGTGLSVAGTAGGLGLLGGLGGASKVGLGHAATQAPGAIPSMLGLGGGSGMLGLGAATIPVIGGLLAGGAYAANKIGQGRRTANKATGEGGFERNFTDALTRISSGQGNLEDLRQAREQYDQNIQAWLGQGGNYGKVAQQSLNNNDLQDTYRRLLAQLGGA